MFKFNSLNVCITVFTALNLLIGDCYAMHNKSKTQDKIRSKARERQLNRVAELEEAIQELETKVKNKDDAESASNAESLENHSTEPMTSKETESPFISILLQKLRVQQYSDSSIDSRSRQKLMDILMRSSRYAAHEDLPSINELLFSDRTPDDIEMFIETVQQIGPGIAKNKNCLILNGPAGTGKSMIAYHLTNEAKRYGRIVINIRGNDIGDRYKNSEKEDLKDIFHPIKLLLDELRDQSVIIFFDELDGIFQNVDDSKSASLNLIKELNDILDTIQDDQRICMVATTNYLDKADSAIFSRCSVIQVPAPDYEQRICILKSFLQKKGVRIYNTYPQNRIINKDQFEWMTNRGVIQNIPDEQVDTLNDTQEDYVTSLFIQRLAYETQGFTGRYLKELVNDAFSRFKRFGEQKNIPQGFGYDIYSGITTDNLNIFNETSFEKYLYTLYHRLYTNFYINKANQPINGQPTRERIDICPFTCYSEEKRMLPSFAMVPENILPEFDQLLFYENSTEMPIQITNFIGKLRTPISSEHDKFYNFLLLGGPNGTGKSSIAERIARLSKRKIKYVTGNFGFAFGDPQHSNLKKHIQDIKLDAIKTNTPVLIIVDKINISQNQPLQDSTEEIRILNAALATIANNPLIAVIIITNDLTALTLRCETIRIQPNYEQRKKIFKYYFNMQNYREQANSIDSTSPDCFLRCLLTATNNWSCSNIKELVMNSCTQCDNPEYQPNIDNISVWKFIVVNSFDFKNRTMRSAAHAAAILGFSTNPWAITFRLCIGGSTVLYEISRFAKIFYKNYLEISQRLTTQ